MQQHAQVTSQTPQEKQEQTQQEQQEQTIRALQHVSLSVRDAEIPTDQPSSTPVASDALGVSDASSHPTSTSTSIATSTPDPVIRAPFQWFLIGPARSGSYVHRYVRAPSHDVVWPMHDA